MRIWPDAALRPVDFFVTIVSFHEQFAGWTKHIARAKDSGSLVRGYTELDSVVDSFARAQVLPQKARSDAERMAIATVHSVEYLLTWNCKHIANAATLPAVYRLLAEIG